MPDEIEGREIARGEFCKFDDEKQFVFGWASLVAKNGQLIVDSQDEVIDLPSLENAAYRWMIKSQQADEMHAALFKADLIESMVFTPEKIEKIGLPAETPLGWWVGFHIPDRDDYLKVKSSYPDFSIRGSGTTSDLAEAA